MKHIATFLSALLIAGMAVAKPITVFSSKFDNLLPPRIDPGSARLERVQGYRGLGTGDKVFSGKFLRSADANVVTLTLTDLPPHDQLNIKFLFAAIDSLDGTGTGPCFYNDYFTVQVDGNTVFRESFANARADEIQSYEPPPGGELARRVNLGFTQGAFWLDSAYDMSVEPRFRRIEHMSSTAVITFVMKSTASRGSGMRAGQSTTLS